MGVGAGELGLVGEQGAHVGGGIVAPAAVAHQGELVVAAVDAPVPGGRVVGLHRHLDARGGEAVADDLRDGQVVPVVAAQKGDGIALPRKDGAGRLRVIGVLHHVLVIVQAALGDVARAAHRARAAEHAVHHALPVDGGVHPLPQGELQKVGAPLVVDEQLIAHVVGLLHHADGRVVQIGVHQVGGQGGDVDLPALKGQQGVAHRHKLDLLRRLLPVAPAVEGSELIAAGGPVIGGAGISIS